MSTDGIQLVHGVRVPRALLEAVERLRVAHPELHAEFVLALRIAAEVAAYDTVTAPAEKVHLAQGAARALQAMATLFVESRQQAETLQLRRARDG